MEQYGPRTKWIRQARFVHDDKFWTSSGVTAGTDLSLHLLKEMAGVDVAQAVAHRAEYHWVSDSGENDPYTCLIPRNTWFRWVYVRIAPRLFAVVFAIGFLFGSRMFVTRRLVPE
eukprot:GFYU01067225.1.p1 GENE.GFYU01067225.1~~GFYU01067225.1.p1  ORF type:complete len:127 (-),score=20.23 GFYU01067225.1:66-410(-)